MALSIVDQAHRPTPQHFSRPADQASGQTSVAVDRFAMDIYVVRDLVAPQLLGPAGHCHREGVVSVDLSYL
jgi:hypothetical protein